MPEHGAGFDAWKDLLRYEEIATLVRYFAEAGIRKLRLTGGEPLVRRDIETLISQLHVIPGIEEIAMSTNAVFLKDRAAVLKKVGLDRVNISLDTLRRDRFEKIARLDRLNDVLEGIKEAISVGLMPLKINAVLMRGVNDDEIIDLVDYAVSLGIEIRFIELMPTNGSVQIDPFKHYRPIEVAIKRIKKRYELVSEAVQTSLSANTYRIKGTSAKVGFISPISDYFCSRCNRVRLKADGMLKTCLHGNDDLDLKQMLRLGVSEKNIKARIDQVVFNRPEQHFLNDKQTKHKDFQMSFVGG